jgi:glycerophosphoryl diester phosphodiesterase
MTSDGKLIIYHPVMERRHLGKDVYVDTMPWEELKELRYQNYDRTPTQFGIITFDELLETFKGRCYINIDKFWGHPQEIYAAIKRHDMVDQMLVKSNVTEDVLRVLEEVAPELPFMPIVSEEHPYHEELLKRNINYIGVEGLYKKDDSYLASREFMDKMHATGQLVWGNAIIYDYLDQLSGGHSDDSALSYDMEYGWGWFAEKPFDVIQTDWPMMLIQFLKDTNRYYR